MKRMFSSALKVPILSWCSNIEPGALKQAVNLARLPFVFQHVGLMPDSHQGYGMSIGGVVGLKNTISPNMVGKDISCGMHAVKLDITAIDKEVLKKIMGRMRELIPVGFNHRTAVDDRYMPAHGAFDLAVCDAEYKSAKTQIGTLGGGNHFQEIQMGSDGHIWFMLHSGSRNLGSRVADYYDSLAQEMNAKWHSVVPKGVDLAFLPVDSKEGQAYINEMTYCMDFARLNRQFMADIIKEIFLLFTGAKPVEEYDVHHNFAALEHHMGQNVWVHRKGATRAYEGEIGLIPGSQGTASYVVKGKGNVLSFKSCSHGAGRAMSRTKAQATLSLADEIKRLDDQGILHGIRGKSDLDEAAGAYKSIDEVMANQADLVDVVVKLQPLAVIKDNTDKRRRK